VRIELDTGAALLAPWVCLEPSQLLIQMRGLLQEQVNSLPCGTAA